MKKQFIVIGLGRFGISIARTLAQKGYNVLAIDIDVKKINYIKEVVTHAVKADATSPETLKPLGLNNFDIAVVSIGNNIHASTLTTMNLKELGVPYVVVKANNSMQSKILTNVGADNVVSPERDMGKQIAQNLTTTSSLNYLRLSSDYSLIELEITADLSGKTLAELEMRNKYNLNVIAIKRNLDLILNPGGNDRLKEGDILVVMGENHNLRKVAE